jgi:hypothetical protein
MQIALHTYVLIHAFAAKPEYVNNPLSTSPYPRGCWQLQVFFFFVSKEKTSSLYFRTAPAA